MSKLAVICMCRLGYLHYNSVVVWFCLLVATSWLAVKTVFLDHLRNDL